MFGFGKAKAYREKVCLLLGDIGCTEQLRVHPSPSSQIESARIAEGYSEHETALLFAYTHTLYLAEKKKVEEAQKVYDSAVKFEDIWLASRVVRSEIVDNFHQLIATRSSIKVRK
jgi:hypothetical protein